ncbi:hypothetical protein ABZV93_11230 [Actinopolymorpha sp. NPDC004070]|uniref:hypothetical protein n=1 Tax=Actinopolymorpha sp. NPDC004070 TaxID=3154548 RepID=UPI0033B80430
MDTTSEHTREPWPRTIGAAELHRGDRLVAMIAPPRPGLSQTARTAGRRRPGPPG